MTPPGTASASGATRSGPGCELLGEGWLQEPVSAVSSLAFVAAGVAIMFVASRPRDALPYAALVAAVGAGSFVQHGPDPAWSDLVHDLPLVAVLAFVGADAAADLARTARRWWWWAGPTLALIPLILAFPRPADLAQVGVAAIAVGLTVARARARPHLRRSIGWSLAVLASGSVVGTLSRAGGPLCFPDSLWQGHAVWHTLASVALVILSPVIGRR